MLWMIIKLIPILLVLSFFGYGFIIYKETNKDEIPTETEDTLTENTEETITEGIQEEKEE